jgi:outer membrane receptor for ferrienterochelin and colicins
MKHLKLKHISFWLFVSFFGSYFAQSRLISGQILNGVSPIEGAKINVVGFNLGTFSNSQGYFELKLDNQKNYTLNIVASGFISQNKPINAGDFPLQFQILLEEDLLSLETVVVTGTRSDVPKYDTPLLLRTISKRSFEATQSLTLSEGLSFSPGLRMENNCQNCGFTQLRMNGLEGPYSQLLINSRPIFSALAGVYGLEMIPASMIERVEVVRGGGSVMYGGNAIAGTVNIITKEPVKNTFEAGWNEAYTNLSAPDRTLFLNGAVLSEDGKMGMNFYGYKRNRKEWDANNDGFSEITQLKNNSFGGDFFYKPTQRGKLKLNVNALQEYRRGGSHFDRAPHLADIAEELTHHILGGQLSWESYSENLKHRYAIYSAYQTVKRDSYYGAGGVNAQPGDTLSEVDFLALNAYGQSNDVSAVLGTQYSYEPNEKWLLSTGLEAQHNRVKDEMSGYQRSIQQRVNSLGNYAQLQYKPFSKTTLIVGGRMDVVDIRGNYALVDSVYLTNKVLPVLVPRFSWMQTLLPTLRFRFSFAQGYRAPQAFNEDLHLETIGGAARFIRLSPELKTERSNSFTGSFNYTKTHRKTQWNLVLEGFYTQLQNPFILSDAEELPNGVSVLTKRNGEGAQVGGLNFEMNASFAQKFILQSGVTQQFATYTNAEILWEGENSFGEVIKVSTNRLLRTPNSYGFLTLQWLISADWNLSTSSVYTGSMLLGRMVNSETEELSLVETPHFWEQNVKINYNLKLDKHLKLQLSAGVQNIFNAYQRDLDVGITRDAGYIYGPNRPRTIFLSLKCSLD